MDTTRTLLPASQVLAEASVLLDGVDPERGLLSDAERLDLVSAAVRLAGRVQALAATLAGEADRVEAAEHQVGVPLASWLAVNERLTRTEAHRLIGQGGQLARFAHLSDAALCGAVRYEQAAAIGGVLGKLPADFSSETIDHAETLMVGYAAEFDSAGLARLTRRLVELLDPVGADDREAKRLERDLKVAKASRHLIFQADGCGSVLIRGSLPRTRPRRTTPTPLGNADRRRRHPRSTPTRPLRPTPNTQTTPTLPTPTQRMNRKEGGTMPTRTSRADQTDNKAKGAWASATRSPTPCSTSPRVRQQGQGRLGVSDPTRAGPTSSAHPSTR